MSFQQGLSGLNAASKSLEVTGNNVANASTVGFKQSKAQFADVFASSLNGAGSSQIGIGTKVANIAQQFTQGNITATNNPLDIAINGGGFFRVSDNGAQNYTRNGQFQLDKSGYVVSASGSRLMGYAADDRGVLATGTAVELQISAADIPAKTTESVDAVFNLDSRAPAITAPFNMNDPKTFTESTSVQVFDSLGNSHSLQTYYAKRSPGVWDVYATADGAPVNYTPPAAPVPVTTLNFTTTGALDTTLSPQPFAVPVTAPGAINPFTVQFNVEDATQFGSNFGVTKLDQDGYTSGRLASYNAGADGKIIGRYTNGQSNVLGQIVLVNFTNPNGLQSLGNNQWAETSESGSALMGTPQTGGLGVLQSYAVEDSNVDLTAELVNMITSQRIYQANAQTIKTEDQIMQTLVNLR